MGWLEKFFIYWFLKFSLRRRYRFKVIGLEKIRREHLSKKGGILFLANHPAEVDPLILINILWPRFRPHAVAADYLFQTPFLRFFLDKAKALSVPNFEDSSNSYKLKQMDKTFEKIQKLLDEKENILIYPAGELKKEAKEVIGGASGIQAILKKVPEANVVLIRTSGLWGSSFSTALSGKTPGFTKPFLKGVAIVFENLFFFTPKRKVTIEFALAEDLPKDASRLEFNRHLEKWYNERGPEPLKLIPYHFWSKKVPEVHERKTEEVLDLSKIDPHVVKRVKDEIERLASKEVKGENYLASDLGFDSLDEAQLVLFLREYFGVTGVYSSDLATVNDVIAIASGLKKGKEREEEEKPLEKWLIEKGRPDAQFSESKTILEAFFENADRMGTSLAAVDRTSGEVSYRRLKLAVIIMAQAISKLSGKNIGIMMPASIGVNIAILATLLAGKIPVMINWTLGPRNLKAVMDEAKIEHTLSSWRFLDRLDNFDLNGLDHTIVLLEEIRRNFSTKDKLKAKALARKKTDEILKKFKINGQSGDETAVILFTSGTESTPKGVPLSHKNILSNQKDALSCVDFNSTDVILGVLPSFHSFGFSVTGLLPLLDGIRVAYLPNPTDGRSMLKGIEKWKVSIVCLAPTFLKNLFRSATSDQLKSLRYIVSGAEKMPHDLYEKITQAAPQVKIIEGYGITECSPILTLNPPDRPSKGVGVNLPRVELLVINPETHEPLGINKEGLILARGPNIFAGYLDDKMVSPFIELEGKKWYVTGDLGQIDERGYLTLSGRLKRFVKIGGEMISLTLIEEALLESGTKLGWKLNPLIPSLAVGAKEGNGTKPEICLFTIFPITLDEANEHLRKSGMSNIFRVTKVQQVTFIPLLGTGKIDYRSLNSRI